MKDSPHVEENVAAELADRERLADLGEIVGPVTHEFNNFLNTLMLQIAVMEMSVPAALKVELCGVKQQAKQMAALIRQVQQYRRKRAGESAPACLNRAAREAAEAVEKATSLDGPRVQRGAEPGAGIVPLELILADGLPLVPAPAADLERMCRFLLRGVASAVAGGGSLILTTMRTGNGAALRLEAVGAAPASLSRILSGPVDRSGEQGLELAACHCLARRLGGSIRAEPTSGGEALVVELPGALG